jgi:asparagine synthase (glutamine-hydrolysing)
VIANYFVQYLQKGLKMCGIAGIIDYAAHNPSFDAALLKRMSDIIAHRGPDDDGHWISPNRKAGFTFRRLAIIDLSRNGHQPMSTPDGRFTIVFNGEIYNHRALRTELEAKGYQYRSNSDTETILYGFAEWGEAVLQKMVGMWGLAIWDDQRQELFCARDRIGIKPLYYTLQGGRFVFASEIKAILQHPQISAAMNMDEVANYLAFSMTGANTMFEGIHKLAPGHFLRLRRDGAMSIEEYWNPLDVAQNLGSYALSEEETQHEIMRLLRQAVSDRMMSDVPFGAFLSGGIDSSTNVALMAELMTRPVDTFTVGFKDLEQYNELEYARRVAGIFKTNHHEIVIDHHDIPAVMERLIWHEDEPNGDPTCIPLHYVSELTRKSGTIVVQVGEGSDEQFAGYGWLHRDVKFYHSYWRAFSALPQFARTAAYRLAAPPMLVRRQFLALDYLRRGAENNELYWGGAVDFTPTHLQHYLSPQFKHLCGVPAQLPSSIHAEILGKKPDADYMQRIVYMELRHRLAELLLMRVDKVTMAHGLEARVPFLDHRLVEFSMTIPEKMKIPRYASEGGETKHLLKKAVEKLLPHDIIYRKKQGFVAPVGEWFKKPLRGFAEDALLHSSLAKTGLLNPDALKSLLNAHSSGMYAYGKSVYSLVNLALWHKRFIG